jgi:hypothetical protein
MATKRETMQKSSPGTQMQARREWELPFTSLQREMNRLFDNFFGGLSLSPWAPLERGGAESFIPPH